MARRAPQCVWSGAAPHDAAERRTDHLHAETGGAPGRFSAGRPLHLHQPACKPGSVRPASKLADVTAIPLVRRLPGASCNLPERQIRTDPELSPRAVPIRFCSRWGLPCRRRCRKRGALLPHRFTLTAAIRNAPRRSVLCGTVPGVRPACAGFLRRTLSGTVCPWSPDFPLRPPFGLWPGAAVRPTDRLGMGADARRVKQAARGYLKRKKPGPSGAANGSGRSSGGSMSSKSV